jgi:hypothetical protein
VNEGIAQKIEDYLKAIYCGKVRSQEGQDNANRIIWAIQHIIESDPKRPISAKTVNLIAREYMESIKVLERFAQVRNAVHKASRIP